MRAVRQFLRASVVDGRPLPELDSDAWELVPQAAADHGLSARLHQLLPGSGAPDGVRRAVQSTAMEALAVQLRARADLGRLAPVLRATGVPWVLVKGPVLADHWYAEPAQRTFVDLDVVVDPSGFGTVLTALEDHGATLIDQNFTYALAQQRAELSLRLPHGTFLDLHWHVLNTPEQRSEFALPVRDLLARRTDVHVAGTQIPTLDATDTTLHLCLHTVLSGGRKLLWYRDLQQVVATGRVDWQALRERADAAGAGLAVGVALDRARRIAEAAVPERASTHGTRQGRAWWAALRALDTVRPLGEPMPGQLSGQLVVQSTRGTTAGSVRALGTNLRAQLLGPLLHNRDHPWRHRGGRARARTTVENPLWEPAADDRDRDRYLSHVAVQAG